MRKREPSGLGQGSRKHEALLGLMNLVRLAEIRFWQSSHISTGLVVALEGEHASNEMCSLPSLISSS